MHFCASLCTNKKACRRNLQAFGGERGIRTPGGSHLNGFQDRRIRPLCHLSNADAKVSAFGKYASAEPAKSKENWCFFEGKRNAPKSTTDCQPLTSKGL